jgi:hypothetical protein
MCFLSRQARVSPSNLLGGASALTTTTVDGEFGIYPCNFLAAKRDTSLDVIYYLLHQSPDALRQLRAKTVTEDAMITNNAKDDK